MIRLLKAFLFQGILLIIIGTALSALGKPAELTADLLHYTPDNHLTAKGSVRLQYEDITISAPEMDADLNSNEAKFSGNVILTQKGQSAQGSELIIHLKTGLWEMKHGNAIIAAERMQGAKGPVYLQGFNISASSRKIEMQQGILTTCDLTHPHYTFQAKSVTIIPDHHLIARDVNFDVKDHTLFHLSRLIIPLDPVSRKRYQMPQVGESNQEGFYIKTRTNYLTDSANLGVFKLDWMQKLGVGTGIEQGYKIAGGVGALSLYQLLDSSQRTGRLEHTQKFGTTILKLNADYSANSYQYSSNSTTKNLLLNLTQNLKNSNTALSLNSNQISGYGNYRTLTSNFQRSQNLSSRLQALFGVSYSKFESPYITSADTEMNTSFELKDKLPNLDLSLSTNRRHDLDGNRYTGDQYYSGVQKLPEAMASTDANRLKLKLFSNLPLQMQLGYGRYLEQPSNVESDRALVQFDIPGKQYQWGRTSFNLVSGFRQTAYGNDAAQYMVKENLTFSEKLGKNSDAAFTYFYQQPHGYTPFRFDDVIAYKVATAKVNWQTTPKLNLMLATGYDYLAASQFNWQDGLMRATYQPMKELTWINSASYNFNKGQFKSVVTHLKLNTLKSLELDTSARWDLNTPILGGETTRQLSAYKTHLKTPLGKQWKIEAYTGKDGLMRYNDYMLTRDLHCWQASIVYVNEKGTREEKGFRFSISLKAFPFEQQFGIGQYGQSLDSSVGEIY